MSKKSEVTTSETDDVGKGLPANFSRFAGLKIIGANVTDVQAVTRPVLKQVDNVPIAVRILSHIYKGQEIKKKRTGGTYRQPANLCAVINMETGEEMNLIANTILRSELDRSYPNQGYVGKYFALVSVTEKAKSDSTRNVRRYDIMEFKVDADVGELPDLTALPPPVTDEDAVDDADEAEESKSE